MAVAVVLSVFLHIQLGDRVDPLLRTLSEYVYAGTRSAAPLFSVMCLALALGSAALLVGIVRTRGRGDTAAIVLLALWCTGLLACAIFPCDPPGPARTFIGQVHNVAAVLAFVSLPAAAWLLAHRGGPACPWGARRRLLRRLTAASVAGLAVVLGSFAWIVFASPEPPEITLGLFERLLFTVDLGLLLVLTRPLLRTRVS
ncbi:DUF998 domain-containing protein [Amycolatopsis suaedae]|uniref:DUF998 domain-containing protein n=1 Tax=Amycolatopsis suaedae TaxID=2510978 RepID=UPI0030B850EA